MRKPWREDIMIEKPSTKNYPNASADAQCPLLEGRHFAGGGHNVPYQQHAKQIRSQEQAIPGMDRYQKWNREKRHDQLKGTISLVPDPEKAA